MFKIFVIRGKRFEYSNNIRAKKFSNPNPNIQDSRKKIRIRIECEYIRSSLKTTTCFKLLQFHIITNILNTRDPFESKNYSVIVIDNYGTLAKTAVP